MLRIAGWLGLYIGTPSVAAYASSVYLRYVDTFLLLFVFSAAALVVAILPRLVETESKHSARNN